MEHFLFDVLNGEELTPENVFLFLDEYLRKITEVNSRTVIDLMLYLDYAKSIKDNELLYCMIERIIESIKV